MMMFRNRKLQLEVVKDKNVKPVDEDATGATFEQKAVIVGAMIERVAKKVLIGVAMFVILDTVRRVAVELVEEAE